MMAILKVKLKVINVRVFEVGFGQFLIFSARHQLDTWTLALQESSRRHAVWRDSVDVGSSGSGL